MVKTKVEDLAVDLGIPSEQLMGLLKEMRVFARGPQSSLEDDQVAAVRVRWERERRKKKTAEPAKPRRRTTKKAAPPEPEAPAAKPAKRRRTAAEVAEFEAQQEAERLAEAAAAAAGFELDRPVLEKPEPIEPTGAPMPTIHERARALFKDLPPLPEAEVAPSETAEAPAPAPPPPVPPAERPVVHRAPFIPPRVQRPGPSGPPSRTPGRGPRPVFSSSPGTAGSGGPPTQRPGRPDGARYGGGPSTPARTFGPDAKPSTGDGRRKGKKGRKSYVDQEAVQANILKTLQGMKAGPRGKRRSDEPSYRELLASRTAEEQEREKTRIRVNEFISVAELAEQMKIPATQIVQFAFKELGLMVTVNQRLDFDQIELIASEFGFQAVREGEYAAELGTTPVEEAPEDLKPRPPVVTIMGHVDHGKTSLLDYIRKTNVVAGEAGGITQHIGAYHVSLPSGQALTFLDTPGHEAFTAMRARGAQVTDLVILVIAADDQVMPQTVEAISHARNAGVPLVVAINKIDLPAANIAKVKQDLLQHNVVLEEFGGTVLSTEISAKKGTGVDELLEKVLLQSELLDLKANPEGAAHGTVLEATLDPGKGPLATILVQRGTLRQGDSFICGKFSGRVRALSDERGKPVKEAGPSIPAQVLGFEGVPSAGDTFVVVTDANEARDIAQKRQRLEREAQNRRGARGATLEDISRALQEGQVSQLKIIIKADQGGPAEALADALAQLSTAEVRVEVIHRGVGAISESDVLLAKASGAIILGFHVRPDANARSTAEREGVDVRTYRIIYEAVEDVRAALEGLLKPEEREQVVGEAEVLQLFKVSKVGTIAGSIVRSGTIQRTARVRVVRDGTLIYTGNLSSLRRFKDDVKEVREGLECGIGVENFNDLKVGDRIEAFRIEEVRRTLQPAAGATG